MFFSFNCLKVEGGSMGYVLINIHDIEPRTHFLKIFYVESLSRRWLQEGY